MSGKTAGRTSKKRQKIFDVYSVMRCALIHEDIKELLERYPGFRDRTMDDTDVEIQEAIYAMAEAMIASQPPDLSQAEPLRE
jgi:hypothetical protein